MRYRKSDGRLVSSTPKYLPGGHVTIVKGLHTSFVARIDRVCNHAWYEINILPSGPPITCHSSYLRPASSEEIEKYQVEF